MSSGTVWEATGMACEHFAENAKKKSAKKNVK
jgi:hypothetical protein